MANLRNFSLSFIVFLISFALTKVPDVFDRPVIKVINGGARQSEAFDKLAYHIDKGFLFSGAVLMALVWALWFRYEECYKRSILLFGPVAAFCAGIISRGLQHSLPSHPRPYYDKALDFTPPLSLKENLYNTWNSFPSDHATVFFGIAFVIFLVDKRLGILSIVWIAIVECDRIFMGAHYPSDIIGSASLAMTIIITFRIFAQRGWTLPLYKKLISRPVVLSFFAWLMSYQIATLFIEMREISGGVFSARKLTNSQ